MDIDLIINGAFLAFLLLITAVFLLQRLQSRRKRKSNKKNIGFHPSTAALGLALLTLQTLAQPDLHHSLEQRQTIVDDEEENGDPDDPFTQLSRQLKRIRNGQPTASILFLHFPPKNRMSSPQTT
jgi:hypothetical protein